MKRVEFFGILLAASTIMAACNNTEEAIVPSSSRATLTIKEATTRTAIDGSSITTAGTYTPSWSATDQIGVFSSGGTANVAFSNASEAGTTAEFSGNATIVEGSNTVYAYYPYGNTTTYPREGDNAITDMKVLIKNAQSPSLTSFDPSADILVATAQTFNAGAAAGNHTIESMRFSRLTNVLRIVPSNIASAVDNEPITSFKLTVTPVSGTNYLTGRWKLDLSAKTAENYGSYQYDFVSATYAATDNFLLNGSNAVYLSVKPQTIAAGSTLLFEFTTANYKVSKSVVLANDLVLEASTLKQITLSLTADNAESTNTGALVGIPCSWYTAVKPTSYVADNVYSGIATLAGTPTLKGFNNGGTTQQTITAHDTDLFGASCTSFPNKGFWLIAIPVKNLSASTSIDMSVKFYSYAAVTYTLLYGYDGSTWTATEQTKSVESGTGTMWNTTFTVSDAIVDGTLYVKLQGAADAAYKVRIGGSAASDFKFQVHQE